MQLSDLRARILELPELNRLPGEMRERMAMAFLWSGHIRHLTKAEILFQEGKHDENTGCLLVEGNLEVRKHDGSVHVVEAPELLGEVLQFTKNRRRTATVEAAGAASVLFFRWSELGACAVQVFDRGERLIIKKLIKDLAKERTAEYFAKPSDSKHESAVAAETS